MISLTSSAVNEDWFDNLCSKVDPDYVPMYNEVEYIQCANTSVHVKYHILTESFLLIELLNAINSRRSPASGLGILLPYYKCISLSLEQRLNMVVVFMAPLPYFTTRN
jgi:hypothetical protein